MKVKFALLSLICLSFIVDPMHAQKTETVGSVGQPLTAGTAYSGVNVSQANVVVRITARSGGLCTGTLLTPTLVLTARHCINGSAGGFTNQVSGLGRLPQVAVGASTATLQSFQSIKSVVLGEPIA